ncbi:Osmotin, thaumatin-like protein [Pleurotus eryngii]|uniref:Osmotin, thaumatin-like protein n=1 Tax=Pleurotus eryngii TaxID=5323 RepID=A0A9P5ZKN5_PLEER|nr:Osmotin, thaumatin-like protein [Pleurotus eryngii]
MNMFTTYIRTLLAAGTLFSSLKAATIPSAYELLSTSRAYVAAKSPPLPVGIALCSNPDSRFICDARTGTGVPPVSVAEWTLQGDGNRDFYDVSLVDGFNLPMSITNDRGCPTADCPVDLDAICPAELGGPTDANGALLGCNSVCTANLDGNPADSANCCSGSHNTLETCPSSGVRDYNFFKSNCPNSYAYAFDEPGGTALFTCDSGVLADYTLTFCP